MPDIAIYVHGVVGRHGGAHDKDYQRLHRGLTKAKADVPSLDASVWVEWGWPHPAATASGDLALAQERISLATADANASDRISGLWVRGLRRTMEFGWSDLVWYGSPDGAAATRHDVWSQILERVPLDEACDLTIIGHSAGALVAHDFLYYLYSGRHRDDRTDICGTERMWDAAEENWRVRRLVTMGAAVAPLLLRFPGMVARAAHERAPWLDPAELGLGLPAHSGAAPLWINLWDRHDIVSFPVAGAYGGWDRIVDLYPDLSDWPPRAHSRYWRSRKVHRVLARYWDA